jgi:uncharacterized membrane protein
VAESIWILPTLAMVAAVLTVRLLRLVETRAGIAPTPSTDTALAVLDTMAAAMFTFIVFFSSALLVAVQLASAQLSPRVISIVFRGPVTTAALVTFVYTFTLTLAALVEVKESVPFLTSRVAGYSSLVSLGVFLFLVDHVAKVLRPAGALWSVAELGWRIVESSYPNRLGQGENGPASSAAPSGPPRRIIRSSNNGVVLALDVPGLVRLAQRGNCLIELAPQVGDYVASGDPLLRIFEGGDSLPQEVLLGSIALGQERTPQQDPAFAFRIIVDIASKALSPAINDPTTAVLAIDKIHLLLHKVGERRLDDERVRDASGRLRFLYRTPGWDDFVHLAVTEVRQFGAGSIQIHRRLRAMLESLIRVLPAQRVELLRKELSLLERSAERAFPDPEDHALAMKPDPQGVGGGLQSW